MNLGIVEEILAARMIENVVVDVGRRGIRETLQILEARHGRILAYKHLKGNQYCVYFSGEIQNA